MIGDDIHGGHHVHVYNKNSKEELFRELKEDKELNHVQKKKKTKDVRERVKVGDPGLNVLLASEGLGLVALYKVGGGQRADDHDDVEPGWPP